MEKSPIIRLLEHKEVDRKRKKFMQLARQPKESLESFMIDNDEPDVCDEDECLIQKGQQDQGRQTSPSLEAFQVSLCERRCLAQQDKGDPPGFPCHLEDDSHAV